MENVTNIINWTVAHWKDILDVVAYVCLAASAIVKVTPTLKDDNIVLPVVKFIGKYIALNKNVSETDRPV